jgi:hypothetical protein
MPVVSVMGGVCLVHLVPGNMPVVSVLGVLVNVVRESCDGEMFVCTKRASCVFWGMSVVGFWQRTEEVMGGRRVPLLQ